MFGLWLNLGEVHLQQAIDYADGKRMADEEGPLPDPTWEAVATTPEEMAQRAEMANAYRMIARAMRKMGR